jgi:hypothetical protein
MFGGKNIENRTWSTAYRGPLAIHSSKTVLAADIAECERIVGRKIERDDLTRGAIVGFYGLTTTAYTKYLAGIAMRRAGGPPAG